MNSRTVSIQLPADLALAVHDLDHALVVERPSVTVGAAAVLMALAAQEKPKENGNRRSEVDLRPPETALS